MADEAGGTGPAQKERSFETGMDEAFKHFATLTGMNAKILVDAWMANIKRTYDEYQQESLESIKRNRTHVDKVLSDAQAFDNATRAQTLAQQQIATQALQNAVETANMVGKQAVRHGDIAIDGQWNPVQQGAADTVTLRSVSLDDASLKAIGATVAASMAQALASFAASKAS